ncbi:hypothetical protein PGTUg99_016430 [Puccinia graminis f. sp. tritici]|uniref:Uncharacterized protein n=1 Tax=Puccinia graminis f. sp. tritici TaxID=56615 RepID=A0A5B0S7K3_PUCGR|nr:hypothetical protein PGTUg99_016430 [Puccinia graminis f. sp. tritici]
MVDLKVKACMRYLIDRDSALASPWVLLLATSSDFSPIPTIDSVACRRSTILKLVDDPSPPTISAASLADSFSVLCFDGLA